MKSFGEQLVQYRKYLGMSQHILAQRSGLNASHLSRIEKGTRKPPKLKNVLAMIEVLHLSPEEARELLQLAEYLPSVLEEANLAQTPGDQLDKGEKPPPAATKSPMNIAGRARKQFALSRYPPATRAAMEGRLWGREEICPVWYLSLDRTITIANLLAFWLWGSPLDEEIRKEDLLGVSVFEVVTRPWNFERIATPETEADFWWATISTFKFLEEGLQQEVVALLKTRILKHPLLRLIYLYGDETEVCSSYKCFLKIRAPYTDLAFPQQEYLEFWGTVESVQSRPSTAGILVSYQSANHRTRAILDRAYQRLLALHGKEAFVQQETVDRERPFPSS